MNERSDAFAHDVIRLLRVTDENLAEKLDSVNRTRERCSWDTALTLCNDYYTSCSARVTASVDCCQGLILTHRGAVYQAMGEMDKARKSYEDSRSLFSFGACGSESSWNEAVACYGLGLVAQSCRDWRLAQQHLEEALEKFEFAMAAIPAKEKRAAKATTQHRLAMLEVLREAEAHKPAQKGTGRDGREDQELIVPIIGRTSAGEPISAMELNLGGELPSKLVLNYRTYKIFPLGRAGKLGGERTMDRKVFAFQIKGTSMVNAKIEDGDYVIFHYQRLADPGDIVVVRIDDIDASYSTVKRFFQQDNTVILKADSPDYPHWERRFTRQDPAVAILGKAIAVAKSSDKALPTQPTHLDTATNQIKQSIMWRPMVEHRRQVEYDEPFEFVVRAPNEPSALFKVDHVNGELMALPSPVYGQLPQVEVVLRTWGFEIDGPNVRTIPIGTDDAEDTTRFALTPTRVGDGQIRTDFYQDGRRIGTYRSNVSVVRELSDDQRGRVESHVFSMELRGTSTTSAADLEWCVELSPRDGSYTLRYSLNSPATPNIELGYHHKKCGEVTLYGSPLEKMKAVYDRLNTLAGSGSSKSGEDRKESERQLIALGKSLWRELIPEELKREYWRFRDGIESLLITSDEPWIPWEILVPYRHNEENDQRFLCQEFDMARWLPGPGTVDQLATGSVWCVAPQKSNLPYMAAEIEFVRSLSDFHKNMMPQGTLTNHWAVLDCLEHKDLSIMHFACHGSFDTTNPGNSAIKLTDSTLTPDDIHTRFGESRPRPLIFINACHGGRTEFSSTGLGGWAAQLITDAHVGAFVGAMWEIDDGLALQFAKTFYTLLLGQGLTLAQAFRQAREMIRKLEPWNSSWLAYTLYAYPTGTMPKQDFDTNLPAKA